MSWTSDTDLVAELDRFLASRASEVSSKSARSVSLVGTPVRGTAMPERYIGLLQDLAPAVTLGAIDLITLKDTSGGALGLEIEVALKGRPFALRYRE